VPLPSFNEYGDLPPGIREAVTQEVKERFGQGSTRRTLLALRLQRIYQLAEETGHLVRFVVFGSFVTAKPDPNDVDVFMIMEDSLDAGPLAGESRLLLNHGAAQDRFGCSVFWVTRSAALGGERAAIERWQIKREGSRRGIVEVISEGS
jgi:hypothetical protein